MSRTRPAVPNPHAASHPNAIVLSLSSLYMFERRFIGNNPSPFTLSFRRLTPPSTERLAAIIREFSKILRTTFSVFVSLEWYPDFDGKRLDDLLVSGELKPIKEVVAFLYKGNVNEKYCWLIEGMDGALYCIDSGTPEGVVEMGFVKSTSGLRLIADSAFR